MGAMARLGLNGAKDLTLSMLTKEEMIATVEQGRGAMMPYRDILSSKEIDAVVDVRAQVAKEMIDPKDVKLRRPQCSSA
jgi:mono/diheme cytochrome c family protein